MQKYITIFNEKICLNWLKDKKFHFTNVQNFRNVL